jgi:hypothetical protein
VAAHEVSAEVLPDGAPDVAPGSLRLQATWPGSGGGGGGAAAPRTRGRVHLTPLVEEDQKAGARAAVLAAAIATANAASDALERLERLVEGADGRAAAVEARAETTARALVAQQDALFAAAAALVNEKKRALAEAEARAELGGGNGGLAAWQEEEEEEEPPAGTVPADGWVEEAAGASGQAGGGAAAAADAPAATEQFEASGSDGGARDRGGRDSTRRRAREAGQVRGQVAFPAARARVRVVHGEVHDGERTAGQAGPRLLSRGEGGGGGVEGVL